MGRPIKEKFFGNTNSPYSNTAQGGGTGLGGEGVATSIVVTNTGTRYSQGSVAVFSAPQLPGGITATGTLTIGTPTTQGRITALTLALAGSGYTSTATVSVTTASSVSKTVSGTSTQATLHLNNTTGIYVGMSVAGNAGLGGGGNVTYVTAIDSATNSVTVQDANDGAISAATLTFADYGSGATFVTAITASQQNAIKGQAFITGGSAKLYDIKKQEASRRYLVKTSDGQGQCKLVTTSTLTAGTMNIEATDWNGSKYYVKKLTARRAVLVQTTATGSFLIADGASTGWTLNGATGTVVTIGNN
jgi:hypothetical protein